MTMTRDEIGEFSGVELNCFETDREEDWYKIGCIDGLTAADTEPNLESIWHDASEKPRAKEWLLIQFGEDDYDVLSLDDLYIDMWCTWCKTYNVIRWAYTSDLLPKGGER